MIVGRTAPRYQTLALLYPRSKSLQAYISEYFIIVVRLSQQVFTIANKSTFQQFKYTFLHSSMKPYQSGLETWADLVKDEVSLQMAKRIEEESQENSRFRLNTGTIFKSQSIYDQVKLRTQILNACSTYDHQTSWKQARKAGNATLFQGNSEYERWRSSNESCTLLCTGILGAGKSVLLANIVDDVNLYTPNKSATVAYFFCRQDMAESLKAQTVIASLTRQLLQPLSDFTEVAERFGDTCSMLDIEKALTLLDPRILPIGRAYFVLDGIDECDEQEILMDYLLQIRDQLSLHLCISMRRDPSTPLKLNSKHFSSASILLMPDDNPDIKSFVSAELERRVASGNLGVGEPALILDIHDALLKGARGMFLWVVLQIESLCSMQTDDAIRGALVDLPKTLSETYTRILDRSRGQQGSYQRRILDLIAVARRPMTIEELREALSVTPGDDFWNPGKLINNVYSVLDCCGSIVIVDEEELTLRFVHSSTKQFLLGNLDDHSTAMIEIGRAENTMSSIILTYLNYNVFDTQLSTRVIPKLSAGTVPSTVIHSTLESSSRARRLALSLLQSRKQSDIDVGKILADVSKGHNSQLRNHYHFVNYAKVYWLCHTWQREEMDPLIIELMHKAFQKKLIYLDLQDDNTAVTHLLLEKESLYANLEHEGRRMLLHMAAMDANAALVKVLLSIPGIDFGLKNEITLGSFTPLHCAVNRGHEAIIRLLLDATPTSSTTGFKEDLISLLGSGLAEPGGMFRSGSILHKAVSNRKMSLIRSLLRLPDLDVNAKDASSWAPLHYAASGNSGEIVQLFLTSDKIDVNVRNGHGETPLHIAAELGHDSVIGILLGYPKIDWEAPDELHNTALFYAQEGKRNDIVDLFQKKLNPSNKP